MRSFREEKVKAEAEVLWVRAGHPPPKWVSVFLLPEQHMFHAGCISGDSGCLLFAGAAGEPWSKKSFFPFRFPDHCWAQTRAWLQTAHSLTSLLLSDSFALKSLSPLNSHLRRAIVTQTQLHLDADLTQHILSWRSNNYDFNLQNKGAEVLFRLMFPFLFSVSLFLLAFLLQLTKPVVRRLPSGNFLYQSVAPHPSQVWSHGWICF